MVRASASGVVDSGLIPSRVKPRLPCLTFNTKGAVWRKNQQVCLLCRWERHLAGFPHLTVVNSCLVTPEGVRYSALIASFS